MKGFSIVEVLIAITILVITALYLLPSFVQYMRVNQNSEIRYGALSAAEQVAESLRSLPFADWPQSVSVDTGLVSYDVSVTSCLSVCEARAQDVRIEAAYEGETYHTLETLIFQVNAP